MKKRVSAKRGRCPFYSRAWNCRCENRAGHNGLCVNNGDAFHGGYVP